MKVVVGSPGTWSGLLLRTGQCVFAGASIGVMVSALGFSNYTAFWYQLVPFQICSFPLSLNSILVALCNKLKTEIVLSKIFVI